MSKWVTIDQIAQHTGRNPETISRALRRTNTPIERLPGIPGQRILRKDANRFLADYLPALPPMRIEEAATR